MRGKRKIEYLGDCTLDAKTTKKVNEMIAQADAETGETRVNFRWGQKQVALVKQVANIIGIPYQTYIKQTLYKQALEDLKAAQTIVGK